MLLSMLVVTAMVASEEEGMRDLRISGEYYSVVVAPHRNTKIPSSNIWGEYSGDDSSLGSSSFNIVQESEEESDSELFHEPVHAVNSELTQRTKAIPLIESYEEIGETFVKECSKRKKHLKDTAVYPLKQKKNEKKFRGLTQAEHMHCKNTALQLYLDTFVVKNMCKAIMLARHTTAAEACDYLRGKLSPQELKELIARTKNKRFHLPAVDKSRMKRENLRLQASHFSEMHDDVFVQPGKKFSLKYGPDKFSVEDADTVIVKPNHVKTKLPKIIALDNESFSDNHSISERSVNSESVELQSDQGEYVFSDAGAPDLSEDVQEVVLVVPVSESSDEEEIIFVVENTEKRKYRRDKVFYNPKQAKLLRNQARQEYGRVRDLRKMPEDGRFDISITPRRGFNPRYSLEEILTQEAAHDQEVLLELDEQRSEPNEFSLGEAVSESDYDSDAHSLEDVEESRSETSDSEFDFFDGL